MKKLSSKRLNLRVGLSSALVVSFLAHAHNSFAGDLGDVIESFRQNRYALANGAGSYASADPADRKVIEQYYSELEASALLSPMTNALEVTSANSQAMIASIQRAISEAGPVSADVESCMNTRELSVNQNILSRSATSARAQLDAGYQRSGYVSAAELDLGGIIGAYNVISSRDWTADFLRCCKREAYSKLERAGTSDRRQTQVAALQRANQGAAQKLEQMYEGGGCGDMAQDIAVKQTAFATQNYFLPSRVIDPLEGLKMNAVEIADVLRSSGVRSSLRRIRENSHSPTQSMAEENSYFEEIDTACRKAKEKEARKGTDFWNVLLKTGANAAICHLIPYMATTNWSTNNAQAAYMVADATVGLPWKDLQCDPGVTAAYRAQRPTDPNAVADKWNIPALQNPVFLNQLRSMVPLQQSYPIVRAPDGSIILPGGVIGGDSVPREAAEAQLAAQDVLGNNGIVRNSTANRMLGSMNTGSAAASSRLAFLSGPAGSIRYVRSTSATGATGRSLAPAVNGVRALAGNIATNNSRASLSAGTLRQSASQARSLAGSIVSSQKGRGLAVMSKMRTTSALHTRNLVGRAVDSKLARTSAEWVAKVLRDRRTTTTAPTGGTDVVYTKGPRKIEPAAEDKEKQIADEIARVNERRRETLLAQADSMVKAIQNAMSRSADIVREIQSKIQLRDVLFNKTVEAMVKKPPKSQYSSVKKLINEDAVRMQDLAALKAEYDALRSSVPMLTSSLNKLGGLAPQIATNMNAGLGGGLTMPNPGLDGRFNGTAGTSVFAPPASAVEQPRVQAGESEFTQNLNILDRLSLQILPEAWAFTAQPGTLAYEQKWAQAYDTFASDWDAYLVKLQKVEATDRAALVKRYRELRVPPAKLELFEPDAVTFSLMWETMEVISDESQYLLQGRNDDGRGNNARTKIFQDVEAAQLDAEKSIDLLAEWAQSYVKSAPETYYNDPQAWEAILPNAIIY